MMCKCAHCCNEAVDVDKYYEPLCEFHTKERTEHERGHDELVVST